MLNRIGFVAFFIMALAFAGCYRKHADDPTQKWVNIHRLFMNEPHSYTFMIKDDPASKDFKMIRVVNRGLSSVGRPSPRIIEDVLKGELMWATAKIGEYSEGSYLYDLEIHIHSVKDVEPGGWEKMEGKTLRKGQNAVIE
ncbi:MAG: hypothetical protein A3C50_01660 [Candidatus Staskawiczbacteria bacterium RIFCSPHIGHO2_02_FULL_43_16]|uniref:Uncharacterized protein n=1 Tax=Candidatus Staskawiczbacteria bacterium RIFCSPHIGHO2_01_FULL_41_41 TaxID=1802203 RepID=A0A1G2HUF6_9BACT|nr:MAG: hypothetical protein A2822_04075 [Candidatus Staskawiczbacteria bacterium RIFCSPHIGHO2_01_FULL_41_41]OGZ69086.1 MAG: hypothetical protein A3C50_01660 [Candidatus Staskawiczbacteria bacterium RIFCSPHIGHO2_02_FULL_43_16]